MIFFFLKKKKRESILLPSGDFFIERIGFLSHFLHVQKKLALDPVQPVVLSNYAQFLATVKNDYDR